MPKADLQEDIVQYTQMLKGLRVSILLLMGCGWDWRNWVANGYKSNNIKCRSWLSLGRGQARNMFDIRTLL